VFDLASFKVVIDSFYLKLTETPENITGRKLSDESWSLKEIVGHLIDSASNNHQRFIRLQLKDKLVFPVYDAEQWIQVSRYNDMNWMELITLWYNFNRVLLSVIEHMKSESLENAWINGEDTTSLSHLVNDYYRHLSWHIDHFNKRCMELEATGGKT
jgi:hypothetical protein